MMTPAVQRFVFFNYFPRLFRGPRKQKIARHVNHITRVQHRLFMALRELYSKVLFDMLQFHGFAVTLFDGFAKAQAKSAISDPLEVYDGYDAAES